MARGNITEISHSKSVHAGTIEQMTINLTASYFYFAYRWQFSKSSGKLGQCMLRQDFLVVEWVIYPASQCYTFNSSQHPHLCFLEKLFLLLYLTVQHSAPYRSTGIMTVDRVELDH